MALGDFSSVAGFGVPAITWTDGPNGVRAAGTTAFPSAQPLASTFDRGVAQSYGQAIAQEAYGKGFNTWLGPAMASHGLRWPGASPRTWAKIRSWRARPLAAEVTGAKSAGVIATLKHYVGNNQEWTRFGEQSGSPPTQSPGVNDIVSRRALQESMRRRSGVRCGVRACRRGPPRRADAVMCSYNRINGLQACQDPRRSPISRRPASRASSCRTSSSRSRVAGRARARARERSALPQRR